MKALTLTEPWASLVAGRQKMIETRDWQTRYTGLLAIHAAKGFPGWAQELVWDDPFVEALQQALVGGRPWSPSDLLRLLKERRGCILAVAQLVGCFFMPTGSSAGSTLRLPSGEILELTEQEIAFGNYEAGRYGWILRDVVALPEPIPARGALNLWRPEAETEARLLGMFSGVMG